MSQIRTELIAPAVNFLKDPKVQISPIQKRVAFLESKGLNSEEIEEALRLALVSTEQLTTTQTITNTPSQQITTLQVNSNNSYRTPSIMLRAPPSPPPRLDWRDYFFVAILIGGTSYAIRVFVKKYILPYFKTLTKKNFNKDKQQLSNQFIITTKNLEVIKSDTQLTKKTIEEHLFKVKETLNTINKVLVNLCETDRKKDRDITIVKLYIDEVRDSISKFFEQTKESQNQSISEIKKEIKYLKSLIINNRRISRPNIVSPIFDSISTASLTITSPILPQPPPPTPTTPNHRKSLSASIPPSVFSSGEIREMETIGSEQDSTPSWKLGMNNTSTATKVLVE